MATYFRLFDAGEQWLDANGDPYSGGKLYLDDAGTSTNRTSYKDDAGASAHTNPIVLDSAGRIAAGKNAYVLSGNVKITLDTSADVNVFTQDDYVPSGDIASTYDEWIASTLTPTFASTTTFTLVGDGTALYTFGRRIKIQQTSGTEYGYIVSSSFSSPTMTVTVALDSSAVVDSGIAVVSYGLQTAEPDGSAPVGNVTRFGTTQLNAAVTVGVNDAGHDVKFFGDTASAHLIWDASVDDLKLVGAAGLTVAGNSVLNTLDVNSTLDVGGAVDIDGAVDMATTALVTGVLTTTATQVATGGITSGSDIVSDTDSTDDLGTTSVRWANLFVDGITATDQITATGFTGTLDGILGSGSAAAATATTLNTSGAVNLNLTTDSTSSTSGALIVDGGVGIAKKLFVGTDLDVDGTANLDVVDIDGAVDMASTLAVADDLSLTSDAAVVNFGVNSDVTLTHVHDSGLTLKNTSTADDTPLVLLLQTGETDIAADDVLGKIQFQAPDEGTGTDAILIAAEIAAVSEGDFAADNNATKLSFKTGASEAATEKMSISSGGNVTIADGNLVVAAGHGIDFSANTHVAGMSSELFDSYEEGTFTCTLTGGNSNPDTAVTATGIYTKAGRFVQIQVYFSNKDTTGADGGIGFSGLPFTNAGGHSPSPLATYAGTAASAPGMQAWVLGGTTTMQAQTNANGAAWVANTHNAGAGRYFAINAGYQAS
jgi:hypothetical protein